ncbi:hypothetical protein NEOLEDRAFT_1176321 [Neolentinus lepideus HHB14362 ss-1]|uniref:Uncharacterized protein n=1 Tax=Neolentinus lepideus HHB14362 ss-1 TaxID=1314782 RepID=A0A165UHT4_9AGAM|nr:hypothetical protein NEOLEDRAFT_1176321 [Neolentinus lepideus HHB14362 ss-1]
MASTFQVPEVAEKALVIKNVVMLDVDVLDSTYRAHTVQVPVYDGDKKIMLCLVLNIRKKPEQAQPGLCDAGDDMELHSAAQEVEIGDNMMVDEAASRSAAGEDDGNGDGDRTLVSDEGVKAILGSPVGRGSQVQAEPASVLIKRVPPCGEQSFRKYDDVYGIRVHPQTGAAGLKSSQSRFPPCVGSGADISLEQPVKGGLNVAINVNIRTGSTAKVQVSVNHDSPIKDL